MSEHLYIHVPFCRKRCRYCDFYSQTDLSLIPDFVSGLIREIRLRSESAFQTRPGSGLAEDLVHSDLVRTVYFGGGTPSILPLDAVERIIETVDRFYTISADAEITLEANPGSLDPPYLEGIRRLGVNRLSLGIQSFDNRKLDLLGRIHTAGQAVRVFETARSSGFDNIGLDLIYGVPGESETSWQRDMDRALDLFPAHLSCYMLTLEPGTPLYDRYQGNRFDPMTPDDQVGLFRFTSAYLERAGYGHYEISNFARGEADRSRHNSAYWCRVPYDGFGPSAHSFWAGDDGREVRFWNRPDLSVYLEDLAAGRLPVAERETINRTQQMLELIMVGLRTRDGIDVNAFDRLSDLPFRSVFDALLTGLASEALGSFGNNDGRFSLTLNGWTRLDNIVEAFADGLREG